MKFCHHSTVPSRLTSDKRFRTGNYYARRGPDILQPGGGTAIYQHVIYVLCPAGVVGVGIEGVFVPDLMGKPSVPHSKVIVTTKLTETATVRISLHVARMRHPMRASEMIPPLAGLAWVCIGIDEYYTSVHL